MIEDLFTAELGPKLHWISAQIPPMTPLVGRYVRLEKLDPALHADALFEAQSGLGSDDRTWLYMGRGPFEDESAFREYVELMASTSDPAAYAIVPIHGDPAGVLTYMRIDDKNGSIEIGHIWYGASIQRTPITTEVVYLTARHAFEDLGYRRFEWKCSDKNERSKRAALRFGFTHEGTFRNHLVQRDRNRDTAWFSITNDEWPAIKAAFEGWLDPANFDTDGRQLRTLASFREE